MSQAAPGSVLVIDRMGNDKIACAGEMSVMNAQAYGLAGIVVDGAVTDTPQIKELGLPVFAVTSAAVACSLKYRDGEVNVPVQCGGCVVDPGDIVFGNADGMIVCPPDEFEHWLEKAEEADVTEVKWRAHFRAGGHLDDLYPIKEEVEKRLGIRK